MKLIKLILRKFPSLISNSAFSRVYNIFIFLLTSSSGSGRQIVSFLHDFAFLIGLFTFGQSHGHGQHDENLIENSNVQVTVAKMHTNILQIYNTYRVPRTS